MDELERFKIYSLFYLSIFSNVYNVQHVFKGWFNEYINTQSSDENDNNDNAFDHDDSIVINAPHSDSDLFLSPTMMNRLKIMKNQLWSLQDAIAYVFYKYLSKRETLRSWSIGLDKRLPSRNKNYSSSYRKRLIQYASYDCLSLMELIMFMHEHHSCRHSVNDLSIQSLGEYFSYLSTKFTSASLVKTRPVCDILLSDDSDDSMTVHDLDARHQSSFHNPTNRQHHNINHYHQNELDHSVNQNHRLFEQFYKNSHRLPIDQDLTNHQPLNQTNSYEDINNHSAPTDSHQETAINDDTQFTTIDGNYPVRQSKHKPRSAATRKRRNHKSSLRHRKNRYKFELIRPVNTSITNVKRILRRRAVHYSNVNIVNSTLYIDLKSQALQTYYDRLLPTDLFI